MEKKNEIRTWWNNRQIKKNKKQLYSREPSGACGLRAYRVIERQQIIIILLFGDGFQTATWPKIIR